MKNIDKRKNWIEFLSKIFLNNIKQRLCNTVFKKFFLIFFFLMNTSELTHNNKGLPLFYFIILQEMDHSPEIFLLSFLNYNVYGTAFHMRRFFRV